MTDQAELTGLHIRLARTIDGPCAECGQTGVVIGPGTGPHLAALRCIRCDCHRGWLSGAVAEFLMEIIQRFGQPTEPIIVRNSQIAQASAAAPLGAPAAATSAPVTATNRSENMYEKDFDDMYGSKYLTASDLHGEQPRRVIGKVEPEELKGQDGTTKRKYLVYLKDEEKALVLNKTNATKLMTAFGKDRSKWIGASVELYAEMTSLGKEGVRLRVLSTAAKPAAPT